jgi:hypothetical protein
VVVSCVGEIFVGVALADGIVVAIAKEANSDVAKRNI